MPIRLPAKKPHTPQSKVSDNTGTLPETLLSIKQAAKYAGVSEITVRRWVKSGDLPHYHAGKQIRIDKAVLVKFMSQY